ILVIGPNLKLMPGALQEVPPFLKGPDDGQHLLVMDLVVALYRIQAFGVEGHWMPLPIIPGLLRQDGPSGKVGAVCFHPEGRIVVREEEDGPGGDGMLESIKSGLLRGSPAPSNVLCSEVK
ncbi:hypothetical protein C0993_003471, partial [Termitomyces sp. T159_Od127]